MKCMAHHMWKSSKQYHCDAHGTECLSPTHCGICEEPINCSSSVQCNGEASFLTQMPLKHITILQSTSVEQPPLRSIIEMTVWALQHGTIIILLNPAYIPTHVCMYSLTVSVKL